MYQIHNALEKEIDTKIRPDKIPAAPSRSSETILLVDNDERSGNSTRTVLQNLGYSVDYHSSSIKALDAFIRKPGQYDCIITDLTMKHLTGLQFSKFIYNTKPLLPVVLCTSMNEQVNVKKLKSLGIHDVVAKPIEKGKLAKVVRKVLTRRKRRKPQEVFVVPSSEKVEKVKKR